MASPRDIAQVADTRQQVQNLLGNAVRLAPAGSAVTVDWAIDHEWGWISVADEGPGISEGHRDRIFHRFFTYRPDDAGDSSHTGLGLALVHHQRGDKHEK